MVNTFLAALVLADGAPLVDSGMAFQMSRNAIVRITRGTVKRR